ncbi:MAG: DUF4058 family protein [Planctomycetaceae bacterium]
MPSPFPGMDPYLESPVVWLDFHNALASEIRRVLNHSLPAPYYAQLEVRTEITWTEAEIRQPRLPDVTVQRQSDDRSGGTAVAVAEGIRTEVSPYWELIIEQDVAEVASVQIKDSNRDHEVVTAIEIVSPANKRPGVDRDKYLAKRREVIESSTSLIELDLLREGERPWTEPQYAEQLSQLSPAPDYLAAVGRSWQRGLMTHYQLFPTSLRDMLPVIPIPLREDDPEITLDLQAVFRRTYEGGPYARGAVNYAVPPDPALSESDAKWADKLVQAARIS